MTSQRLAGCGTALVTPFTKSGEIDEQSLRAFVDWQISSGVQFVVPCGSTGEAATMTVQEHRRVVEITVEQTAGRVPVVAGAASNDTKKAIALSREVESAGATPTSVGIRVSFGGETTVSSRAVGALPFLSMRASRALVAPWER
jgi:4-hydroxy-tetrahydrodipicolinate synthase